MAGFMLPSLLVRKMEAEHTTPCARHQVFDGLVLPAISNPCVGGPLPPLPGTKMDKTTSRICICSWSSKTGIPVSD
jgi:hypothetical protein